MVIVWILIIPINRKNTFVYTERIIPDSIRPISTSNHNIKFAILSADREAGRQRIGQRSMISKLRRFPLL